MQSFNLLSISWHFTRLLSSEAPGRSRTFPGILLCVATRLTSFDTPFSDSGYASKHAALCQRIDVPLLNLRLLLIQIGLCIEPQEHGLYFSKQQPEGYVAAGRGAATCAEPGSCEHGDRSTPLPPSSLSFGSADGDLKWPSAPCAADSAAVCTQTDSRPHILSTVLRHRHPSPNTSLQHKLGFRQRGTEAA